MDAFHAGVDVLSSALDAFRPMSQADDVGFFFLIYKYLNDEIAIRFALLLSRTFTWVGAVGLLLMSLWVWWQGYRIVTGQSREPMMEFFSKAAQRVFIMALAFGASVGSIPIYSFLSTGMPRAVNEFVTGSNRDPADAIDGNLVQMQVALTAIDTLQTGDSTALEDQKSRAQWLTGIGTAGPAVIGGVLLLMNKIAMGLFVGFAPLFIICLLFDFTKQLFSKWLFYGLATMFSLALLSMMVDITTNMVTAVAQGLWASDFLENLILGGSEPSINSRALQTGGLGMILSLLLISVPPMAGAFFNGVMGSFTGFNAFAGMGGGVQQNAQGQPMNAPGRGAPSYVNQNNAGQGGSVGRSTDGSAGAPDPRALAANQRAGGAPAESSVPQTLNRGMWGETPAQQQAAQRLARELDPTYTPPPAAPSAAAPAPAVPPPAAPPRNPGGGTA